MSDGIARAVAFCADTPGMAWLIPVLEQLPDWMGAGLESPLPLILFLTGLAGSATHCIGMCGPFVAAQVVTRLDRMPAETATRLTRLQGGALIPYHLGRSVTYALLGGIAGGLTQGSASVPGVRFLSVALLILAALALIVQAFGRLAHLDLPLLTPFGRWVSAHARPLLHDSRGGRGFLLGIALGFLPCGLVYGAIAAAGSAGSFLQAALAMVGFSLGTMPMLLGVGLFGAWFGRRWLPFARVAAIPLLVINALMLLVIAAITAFAI